MNPYDVAILQRDPPHHQVVAKLGDKPPTPSEGGGGWEPVTLSKRAAVLVWKGRGLMSMQLPILFAKFIADEPVVPEFSTLLHFWRPATPTDEPAVVHVHSLGDVVPYQELDWVVNGLEWGEAMGNDDGQRTRQELVVTLLEYRADERLKTASAKKKKKKGRRRTHIMLTGETLASVAHHEHMSWKKLGNAQHPKITDPRYSQPGKHLVIP